MIKGASLYALEGRGGTAADQTDGKLGTGNTVEIVRCEIFQERVTRDVHEADSQWKFPLPVREDDDES